MRSLKNIEVSRTIPLEEWDLQLADMASFYRKETVRKLKENQSSHRFDEP